MKKTSSKQEFNKLVKDIDSKIDGNQNISFNCIGKMLQQCVKQQNQNVIDKCCNICIYFQKKNSKSVGIITNHITNIFTEKETTTNKNIFINFMVLLATLFNNELIPRHFTCGIIEAQLLYSSQLSEIEIEGLCHLFKKCGQKLDNGGKECIDRYLNVLSNKIKKFDSSTKTLVNDVKHMRDNNWILPKQNTSNPTTDKHKKEKKYNAEKQNNDWEHKYTQNSVEIKLLRVKNQELNTNYDDIKKEFDDLKREYNALELEKNEEEKRYDGLKGEFNALERRYNELELNKNNEQKWSERQRQKIESKYNKIESKYKNNEQKWSERQRQKIESKYNKIESKYNKLKQKHDKEKYFKNTLEEKYNNLLFDYKYIQSNIDKLETERNEMEMKCIELERKCNKYEKRFGYLNWNSSDIAKWIVNLNKKRYNKYYKDIEINMEKEGIDGECLVGLDKHDLHRMGIIQFKDKRDIIYAINELVANNKNNMVQLDTKSISENECIVCLDNQRSFLCVPCGHLCCCDDCRKVINGNCPICQTSCKSFMKVYW